MSAFKDNHYEMIECWINFNKRTNLFVFLSVLCTVFLNITKFNKMWSLIIIKKTGTNCRFIIFFQLLLCITFGVLTFAYIDLRVTESAEQFLLSVLAFQ